MTVKDLWGLVKAAASAWVDDYAQSMGAALAYYTMFSIAPLLLIVISIAGLVFGDQAARGEIFNQLEGILVAPDALAAAVTSMLFTIGKFLIGVYIGRSSVASGFGAAASLVVVLVWIYYSAEIFL